tara:strand:+ start:52 stop:405 length:354 start_codon:yes stop_codon:yes gene_type:complete
MNKTISKLPNGDFQVEPDNTIRKMLEPKYLTETKRWRDIQDNAQTDDLLILDDIILSAHRRIAMYQTLQKGMWYSIFRPDNTDEIVRERELIREYETMREEIIKWKKMKKDLNETQS